MKKGYLAPRWAKSLPAVGLAVFFLLAAVPGDAFGQTPAGARHYAVSPPPAAIAPEEVAARSEEVANLLISFSEKLAFSPEIEKIKQALPDISRQIDLDAVETAATPIAQPPLAILEVQRALWQRRQLQVSTWLSLLTQRAVALQVGLDRLSQMKATWTESLEAAQAGQAPQAVIELLEKTAREHPAVLITPAPKGLFMGYGDSSINFELRAWTDQSANWAAIRSELATAVYDAVYAAGMAFPFPQREVRVLGNANAAMPAGLRQDGKAEAMQKEN